MSKQSYVKGFCKAAEAQGVDPYALAKFAEPIFKTNGKVPDYVVPPPNEKRIGAERARHAIRNGESDYIPSITAKGLNGRWGVQQTKGGLHDEIMKTMRQIDAARAGDGVARRENMTDDEHLAWLNAHFRSLLSANHALSTNPYSHAGNAYNGAMHAFTNDFPTVVGSRAKENAKANDAK